MKLITDLAFSGHSAKRRVYNCVNDNLFDCYFNINKKCIKHDYGIYVRIGGDTSQPYFLNITEDNKYVYRNSQNHTVMNGNHPIGNNCNSIGLEVIHRNSDNILISTSKIIYDYLDETQSISTTKGTAYAPGKFNNILYIGSYNAIHKYNKLNNGNILYNNNYIFENGQISSASYILYKN